MQTMQQQQQQQQAQRDSEKKRGRDRLWALTSLCFSMVYDSDFSQNYELIFFCLNNWLNQTLSMYTDFQDNNLHQWIISV